MNDSADYGSYGVYLYVPVIHEGIRRWLLRHFDARFIALVGPNTLSERRSIVKDIRRMPTDDVLAALRALQLTRDLRVLEFEELSSLEGEIASLVMPKDELLLEVVSYLPTTVIPVFESAFLRWDHGNVIFAEPRPVSQKGDIALADIWGGLDELASWSPDWWRQVASALIVNGEVAVAAHNRPLPNEEAVLMRGDPRAIFNKGVHIELSSYLHAEAHVIAEAARRGIATEGADLYVTTFPCPVCAKLLAATGIARLYYRDGYSVLDGEEVLLGAGIEIVQAQ
ncbi:MAG: dCMP deaminase [Patescibacteria group bacterium]|nr:dCMP deaminase [Patescibacteria group bacterium]